MSCLFVDYPITSMRLPFTAVFVATQLLQKFKKDILCNIIISLMNNYN